MQPEVVRRLAGRRDARAGRPGEVELDRVCALEHVTYDAECGRDAEDVRLVVDLGYGYTKFGLAGEAAPTCLTNTIREGKNYKVFPLRLHPARSDANGSDVAAHAQYMIRREKLDAMAMDWDEVETQVSISRRL